MIPAVVKYLYAVGWFCADLVLQHCSSIVFVLGISYCFTGNLGMKQRVVLCTGTGHVNISVVLLTASSHNYFTEFNLVFVTHRRWSHIHIFFTLSWALEKCFILKQVIYVTARSTFKLLSSCCTFVVALPQWHCHSWSHIHAVMDIFCNQRYKTFHKKILSASRREFICWC